MTRRVNDRPVVSYIYFFHPSYIYELFVLVIFETRERQSDTFLCHDFDSATYVYSFTPASYILTLLWYMHSMVPEMSGSIWNHGEQYFLVMVYIWYFCQVVEYRYSCWFISKPMSPTHIHTVIEMSISIMNHGVWVPFINGSSPNQLSSSILTFVSVPHIHG